MRHMYSPTPGEFLVGNELERHGYYVYLPARDVGIDLLAERDGRPNRIQVKESRTYPNRNPAMGWHSWSQLGADDLTRAADLGVDFFVFVVHAPDETGDRLRFAPYYVVIKPGTLDTRLAKYHGRKDRAVYWHRDRIGYLWEVRGMATGRSGTAYKTSARNFTRYLDAWHLLR